MEIDKRTNDVACVDSVEGASWVTLKVKPEVVVLTDTRAVVFPPLFCFLPPFYASESLYTITCHLAMSNLPISPAF